VERVFGELSLQDERTLGTLTVVFLMGVSTGIGLLWDPRRWCIVAALLLVILLPLYTTFGTNPDGAAGAFWTSLSYWIDQHGVNRGTQPWFYYLMMVPFYETLTLVPALIGGVWLVLKRRDGFAAMLLFWALGTWIALSASGEKMPWLIVPIALPLAFLAAYVLGRLLPHGIDAVRAGRGTTLAWASAGAGTWVMAVLLAHTIWTDINLNIRYPDTPVEPMMYSQASPDIPPLADDIKQRLRDGRATSVFLDGTSSTAWPWAWYLRGEPVQYGNAEYLRDEGVDEGVIVIAVLGSLPPDSELREQFSQEVPYRHRWFFPENYKQATWGSFARGMLTGAWPRTWLDFALHRADLEAVEAWSVVRGEVLYP
jgi:hypothetical protein